MSALTSSRRGELTDRCIMVILDNANNDVLEKVMMVYFHHFLSNNLYLTDLEGVCKKTCIHELDVSVATWAAIFKIINLAGYYIVHDINYSDLWVIGTYEDLVLDKKYVNYIQLLSEFLEEGGEIEYEET